MPRNGYIPLPHAQSSSYSTAEEEMEGAFESDDEHLTHQHAPAKTTVDPARNTQEGNAYDFEREYDLPPPGSPPAADSLPAALGNTNGIVPSPSEIPSNESRGPGASPSFLRRAVGALLPQHYARVPTSAADAAERARGSGIENDGVFSNVLAKPARPRSVQDESGNVQVMPEETQKDAPPSYAAAQADAVPPYWETTVHAPAFGGDDDLLIDGLPSGTIFSFAWNFLISISFQFVGFMLTYLLHTTHAAKYGSRAGLGVTLIQYGLYSQAYRSDDFDGSESGTEVGEKNMGNQALRLVRRGYRSLSPRAWVPTSDDSPNENIQVSYVHDWLSFLLMTIGWFLLLSSIIGFARVKRWEHSIRTPTPEPMITREALEHDEEVRHHLEQVFGLDLNEEQAEGGQPQSGRESGSNRGNLSAQDEEFRRNLQAIGLL